MVKRSSTIIYIIMEEQFNYVYKYVTKDGDIYTVVDDCTMSIKIDVSELLRNSQRSEVIQRRLPQDITGNYIKSKPYHKFKK